MDQGAPAHLLVVHEEVGLPWPGCCCSVGNNLEINVIKTNETNETSKTKQNETKQNERNETYETYETYKTYKTYKTIKTIPDMDCTCSSSSPPYRVLTPQTAGSQARETYEHSWSELRAFGNTAPSSWITWRLVADLSTRLL